MTTQQLLIPRFKVIAVWPYSDLQIGQVLEPYGENLTPEPLFQIGQKHILAETGFSHYPHIFYRLQWWEERSEEDLPKFIKFPSGLILLTEQHIDFVGRRHATNLNVIYKNTLPSTEEEYNQQQQNQLH